jgi:hypothetical protein
MPEIKTPTPGPTGAGAGTVTEQQQVLDTRTHKPRALDQATPPSIARAVLPASYQNAKAALAECTRIDECQDWANKAEALASYAKQAQDDGLRRMADRIQARAIRRCGELLQQIASAQGSRTDLEPCIAADTKSGVARRAGLSKRKQITATRVARIPRQEFEQAVESEEPRTVTALSERGVQKIGDKEAGLRAMREQAVTEAEAPHEAGPVATIDQLGERIDALRLLDETIRLLSQRSAEVLALPRHVRVGRAMQVLDALGIDTNDLVPPGRR